MHVCEFCDAGIAEIDGAVVPGAAMMVALNQGYKPMQCPNWTVMHDRVAASLRREHGSSMSPDAEPIDEAEVYARWNRMLRTPEKSWRLCNPCFSTLGPYLPPRPVYPTSEGESSLDGMEYVLPVNTSLWAIAAGYFGLFAVLFFPAPIALILGIIALWDVNVRKRRGEKIAGKGRAIFGLVMGAIFSLLMIGFLLMLFVAWMS